MPSISHSVPSTRDATPYENGLEGNYLDEQGPNVVTQIVVALCKASLLNDWEQRLVLQAGRLCGEVTPLDDG